MAEVIRRALDQYLRDISIYPLITREDEVALAQKIRVGDQEALDKLGERERDADALKRKR